MITKGILNHIVSIKHITVVLSLIIIIGYTVLPVVAQQSNGQAIASPDMKYGFQDVKSQLTEPQKKLSTDLLQLTGVMPLVPGQTADTKKEEMMQLRQLIPASQALTQASGSKVAEDLVHIYIAYESSANKALIESYVWNVTAIDDDYGLMVAWVGVNELTGLAAVPGVKNIRAVEPPLLSIGSNMTQGGAILRTTNISMLYGFNGSGIKVGILSDGVDHLSASIASGDLPPNVHVLSNNCTLFTVGKRDEGTAMLEIVHDMAPGAELYFHDCGNSLLEFNDAIDELQANGCTVICDDLCWYQVPYFADGVIASHISGLLNNTSLVYTSSADNYAWGHYQGMYCRDGTTNRTDFSNGTDATFKKIYYDVPAYGSLFITLEWNDKFGNSSNDYDLYLINASNGVTLAIGGNVQNGTQDPYEHISWQNTNNYAKRVYVDVDNYLMEAQPRILEIYTLSGSNYVEPYNTNMSDSMFGHPAVTGVVAAAAIAASDPGNNDVEYYSSRGPVTISFPTEQIRPKPDISGIDGVNISGAGGFGSWSKGQAYFYGTSAAAPHIAGVVALNWAAYPTKTPAEIRNMLYSTAVDIGAAGRDNVSGYGRADALGMFLKPNGTLAGRVTAAGTSIGIGGAHVALVNVSNTSERLYETTANALGYYQLTGVRSLGNLSYYRLYAYSDIFGEAYSSPISVPCDTTSTADIEIVLKPARIELAADSGSVTSNGTDRTNVTAYVYDALGDPVADGYPVEFILNNTSPGQGSLGTISADVPAGYNLSVTTSGGTAKARFGWASVTGTNVIKASYRGDPGVNGSISIALSEPVLSGQFVSSNIESGMILGHTYDASITFKNTGTVSWTEADKVRLAVWGNNAVFGLNGNCTSESGYAEYAIPAGTTVLPNGEYTWHFNATPTSEGNYWLGFGMVKDSATPVFFSPEAYAFPAVTPGTLNAHATSVDVPGLMVIGQTYPCTVTLMNDGTAVWMESSKIRLATWGNNVDFGLNGNLTGDSGYAEYMVPAGVSVMPGEEYTWHFNATTTDEGGHWIGFGMVKDAVAPTFFGTEAYAFPYVWLGTLDSQVVSVNIPDSMAVWQPYDGSVTFRNNGTAVWTESSRIRLAAWGDNADFGLNGNLTGDSGYAEYTLPSGMTVMPGQEYTWHLVMTPTDEGSHWLGLGMAMDAASPTFFGPEAYAFPYVWLGTPSASYVSDTIPDNMVAGQTYNVSMTFSNDGTAVWTESSRIRLATWGNNVALGLNGNCRNESGYAEYAIPAGTFVYPGQEYTWYMDMVPESAGYYWIGFSPMKDSVTPWFFAPEAYAFTIVTES